MTDPLVSAAWLKVRINAPDVRVVDASWYMPGDPRDPDAEFLRSHIPGAVRFDFDKIADKQTDLPHMLPDPLEFARTVGAMGIGNEHRVVVYASEGIAPAARVWWMFRVMGHDAVSVLDGGMPKWIAARGPIQAGHAPHPPAQFRARYRKELVKSFDQVSEILDKKSAQVVDVRAAARFRGEAPEPRAGLRSGHMPGAMNLPVSDLMNADGTMKAKPLLKDLFSAARANIEKPMVTSCGSGVTAAVAALAMARLGQWDTAVYDGSWTEWGGRPDAAVVTGPA
jgi:thiosulfate/3-mercaptopyruvate sulfurtransferase